MRISRAAFVLLVLTACYVATAPVHAYIDPGSTSLLLQGIIGGIAALLVVTKTYWRRATGLFRRPDVPSQPPGTPKR